MPSKAVADAVEARLAANWNTTPIFGINEQGMTPGDGSPFVAVQYPVQGENQLTLGSPGANHYREAGAFRVVVNEQRGIAAARALGWCDTLRALFRGQYFDGVQTFAPSPPVINDANDLGNYFQVSFAVPYRYYIVG